MKTTKTIIRIEHPEDGLGMFADRTKGVNPREYGDNYPDIVWSFDFRVDNVGRLNEKHGKMQSARLISGFTKEYFCAYPSIESMKKWINCEEIKELIKVGFVVLVLDVTTYIKAKDQILFLKSSIVSSKDISSLFV